MITDIAALRIDKDVPAQHHSDSEAFMQVTCKQCPSEMSNKGALLTICSCPLRRWCSEAPSC